MQPISTLAELDARLHSLQQAADASSSEGPGRIPMGQLFKLAENFIAASPEEIEALLNRPDHPPRVVAVSIMDFQARQKNTSEDVRRDALRYAIERLPSDVRDHYLGRKRS